MSAKFLLPCSCGAKIAIDVGKAGRMVRCRCGRKTEVPTMREIKKLQPLQERTIDSAGEWNLRRAIAFAGALATLVALLSAGSLWLSSPLSPQQNGKLAIRRRLEKMVDQSFVRQRQIEENMAKKTTIEVYQEWQKQRQKDVIQSKNRAKNPTKGLDISSAVDHPECHAAAPVQRTDGRISSTHEFLLCRPDRGDCWRGDIWHSHLHGTDWRKFRRRGRLTSQAVE